MEELPITVQETRVLILGYGRLGKVLAQRFAALGARVAVAARKYADLAWAEAFGYEPVPLGELQGRLCSRDLVVNTAPACLLGEEELKDLRPGCLVIDLASKPGGAGVGFAQGEGAIHRGRTAEGFYHGPKLAVQILQAVEAAVQDRPELVAAGAAAQRNSKKDCTCPPAPIQ